MRRNIYLLGLAMLTTGLTAKAQLISGQSKPKATDWYNLSLDQDKVYGAEINKAYTYLKGRKVKKKPVVAIIGTGLDVEHKELKKSLWTIANQKASGFYNDGTGWFVDILGCNFLGNANGEMAEETNTEVDREFLRLRDKYEGVFFDGKQYMKYNDLAKKMVVVPAPVNMAEYRYFRHVINQQSTVARLANTYQFDKVLKYYFKNFMDKPLMEKYHNEAAITAKEFKDLYDPKNPVQDSLWIYSYAFANSGLTLTVGAEKLQHTYASFKKSYLSEIREEDGKARYDKALAKVLASRKEVGDDWKDLNVKNYGNHNLYTSNSTAGTMVAGIIAGDRQDQQGVNGIADAQVMTLRAFPEKGDGYFKDIALAIRYAVDKKADVILLGRTFAIYPEYQSKWLEDALLYAEEKGILVVASAWETYDNLSQTTYYPNKHINKDKERNNFLLVAASDTLGKPTLKGNYSKKELDLYAPGVGILAASMGDTYKIGSGPILAAAAVAGVAAMVKSYYPELNATQLRNLIVQNVTSRKGAEVEKMIVPRGGNRPVSDLFLFEELCSSGGILNAYKTLIAADKLMNSNKTK
jgi:thermitase